MIKQSIKVVGMVLGAFLFVGCGEKVQINSGEVGKQLTTSGLEKQVRTSGAFMMDTCFPWTACPKLVRLQITKIPQEIPGKFYIPKSNLEIEMNLALQMQPKKDEAFINTIFDDIKALPDGSKEREMIIPTTAMFNTYIKPVLRDTVREALSKYTVEEIMENLGEVRKYVHNQVQKKIGNTPVMVPTLAFEKVSWPKIILDAKEKFAAIETQKATEMKAMAAELEILSKKKELRLKEAQVDIEVDKIVSNIMDEKMATYLYVRALQTAAENGTPFSAFAPGNTIIPGVKK